MSGVVVSREVLRTLADIDDLLDQGDDVIIFSSTNARHGKSDDLELAQQNGRRDRHTISHPTRLPADNGSSLGTLSQTMLY